MHDYVRVEAHYYGCEFNEFFARLPNVVKKDVHMLTDISDLNFLKALLVKS